MVRSVGFVDGEYCSLTSSLSRIVTHSLGTFVFTFVSQHTVHLAFHSLKPELRTLDHWRTISTVSIAASLAVSLSIAFFVYLSFGQATQSDIFQIYPDGTLIDLAKLLLCVTMLLTFPLPFFACRELMILACYSAKTAVEEQDAIVSDLEEPLLGEETNEAPQGVEDEAAALHETATETTDEAPAEDAVDPPMSPVRPADVSVLSETARFVMSSFLMDGEETQLRLPWHLFVTIKLWIVVTGLAIAAPSLGDVLDLVGCATGTMIAFVCPAALSLRLEGYTRLAAVLMGVGIVVGSVGSFFGARKLLEDMF